MWYVRISWERKTQRLEYVEPGWEGQSLNRNLWKYGVFFFYLSIHARREMILLQNIMLKRSAGKVLQLALKAKVVIVKCSEQSFTRSVKSAEEKSTVGQVNTTCFESKETEKEDWFLSTRKQYCALPTFIFFLLKTNEKTECVKPQDLCGYRRHMWGKCRLNICTNVR